ncbi:MAG: alanine dehydrogenase [Flavobacteriales bacterium]|nr:alanine dehydrogenase [Flavobacteriales bacterium]
MKIGIIKEGKTPPDERVPLSPTQCKEIMDNFPSVDLVVQNSDVRRFKASEYEALGVKMVDSVDDCDVLLGVKEVPINQLIPNKTYFYFSHTTKKQDYNRNLLIAMIEKNIAMVDYEGLTNEKGVRLIGFGKYAGIVGCYNSFYAYGKRTGNYDLKRAYLCEDRAEMESEFSKVVLPPDYKIVLSGTGRVAKGAGEIMEKLNIKRVSPKEFLEQTFTEPVYTSLLPVDCHLRKDGEPFVKQEYYDDPTHFECTFMDYAKVADMYIACHFWDSRAPFIFTREDAKSPDFKIKVVGDISCDIDGPVACTLRPSTIKDPLYAYHPQSETESDCDWASCEDEGDICVMAVDNLPCELPKDASIDFGREFIDKVLPHLIDDKEGVIDRATICKGGDLTPHHEFLRNYINGEVIA